jgi:hypothetical protein
MVCECVSSSAWITRLTTSMGCSVGKKNCGDVMTVAKSGVWMCPGQTSVVRIAGHLYLRHAKKG